MRDESGETCHPTAQSSGSIVPPRINVAATTLTFDRRCRVTLPTRWQNPAYAVLRREIGNVGKELEGLSYDGILEIADKQSRCVSDAL